jgi:uridine kinase
VDYERFYEEVLLLLISGKPFSYRKFNPIEQTLGVPESVLPKQFTIVEGAYSLHPKLKSGYDFKILLKITPDLQELRILKRNGEDGLNRFKTMWIPLENAYFEAYPLDTEVDLIIDVC